MSISNALNIGIEKTRTVDEIIAEYFRQELALERPIKYPLIDDQSFDLIVNKRYKAVERDGRYYMELIGSPHVWEIVFQKFPYIPTDEELLQARDLYSRRDAIYRDAVIGLAQLAREYNLK